MKQNRKKNREMKTDSEISGTMLNANIKIIGFLEKEDKRKGHDKIFEEKIVKNFPEMGKGIDI